MSEKKWEQISKETYSPHYYSYLYRMEVPGGWIYKAVEYAQADYVLSVSICFVPTGGGREK